MAVVDAKNPIITFLSDFGVKDNYVGIVKGVIAQSNPRAKVIDISHEVSPFDIAMGKYLLETSYERFPEGTIHLAVIDPGVGTKRRAIMVETGKYFFIGPDNGLFSFLRPRQIRRAFSLTKSMHFLKEISATFHARDIFAPTAAYLSTGGSLEGMATRIKGINGLADGHTNRNRGKVVGELIYIDHFGNLVTSIRNAGGPLKGIVHMDGFRIGPVRETFGSVPVWRPVCYINSFGYLEIAVREGSAAEYFGVKELSRPKILIAPGKGGR
jgi:S-adenosylmethionine hydrolase